MQARTPSHRAKQAKQSLQNARMQNTVFNFAAQLQNLTARLNREEKPRFVVLELSGSYPARTARKLPEALLSRQESLEDFLYKLELLARADWLEGVVIRLGEFSADWATAYAIRGALEKLSHHKKTYALASSLNMRAYFALSSASQLIVPESADFELLGFAVEESYLRDLLGRYGVKFEAIAIKEYKSAAAGLTQQGSTPEQREQTQRLIESLQETFCNEVARSRKLTPEAVAGWLNSGISSAHEALRLGVVDRVAYEDELLTELHQPFSSAARHLTVPMRELEGRVAVVRLEGIIMPGRSRQMPFLGNNQAGSETLIRALRAAEEDPSSKAIVLYVNSGGGSALASDLIWREVKRIGAKKPIVAVMGAVAASGGYYVLTHARHVIAAPTTLTGSIGVVLTKAVLEDFNSKYGINTETHKTAPYADLLSSSHSMTEQERHYLERMAAEVYDRFVSRVAEGRGLSGARVNELGRGRVWTGADALERGLVDELGTLERGIEKARELAGLSSHAAAWTVDAPRQMVLPEGPAAALEALMPLASEKVLLTLPWGLRLR